MVFFIPHSQLLIISAFRPVGTRRVCVAIIQTRNTAVSQIRCQFHPSFCCKCVVFRRIIVSSLRKPVGSCREGLVHMLYVEAILVQKNRAPAAVLLKVMYGSTFCPYKPNRFHMYVKNAGQHRKRCHRLSTTTTDNRRGVIRIYRTSQSHETTGLSRASLPGGNVLSA